MASDRYDRSSSSRRSAFGYWVPLIVTVTFATAGIAAWIWSERRDGHDDDHGQDVDSESETDEHLSYGEDKPPAHPPRRGEYRDDSGGVRANVTGDTPAPPYPGPSSEGLSRGGEAPAGDEEGFVARMQDVIRRTPSPQQLFDSAGRRVAAGVAAAGAAVGGVLTAIREEERDDFADHSRWSEEAIMRRNVEAQSADSARAVDANAAAFAASMRPPQSGRKGKRRTVCVVLSAEAAVEEDERSGVHTEHASILSLLPPINHDATQLFVLIYAPSLNRGDPAALAPSLTSSYSAISTPAQTPGEERLAALDPQPYNGGGGTHTPMSAASNPDSTLYASLHAQAQPLVERATMVLPFTTPSGHVHLLRHLAPDLVYVTEPLAGSGGECVEQVRGWVGQVVVVVGGAGDGAGLGGLVDTEDEEGGERRREQGGEKWWESAEMVGLGKGIDIVDGIRVAEDFERRVGGRE